LTNIFFKNREFVRENSFRSKKISFWERDSQEVEGGGVEGLFVNVVWACHSRQRIYCD
jgi:hypothetical protein